MRKSAGAREKTKTILEGRGVWNERVIAYLDTPRFMHIDHHSDAEISRRMDALSNAWYALTDKERQIMNELVL